MSRGRTKKLLAGGPRGALAIVALACGATLCLLVAAPALRASYDPLGSGTTKLSFGKAFLSLMKAQGVTAVPKAPAARRGGAIVFPVSGGKMDPTSGKGEADQLGNLI